MNNHTILLDIRRDIHDIQTGQEATDGPNQLVSMIFSSTVTIH